MKHLIIAALAAVLCWHCQSAPKTTKTAEAAVVNPVDMARQTHKEAMDTLLAEEGQPLKPLVFTPLDKAATKLLLDSLDLSQYLVKQWPDNGFYGSDHYRIEFIFTSLEKTINEPGVYAVTGKNRFKNTISNYKGLLEITEVMEFTDPNLDTADLTNMGLVKAYALKGKFRFHEDSTLNTSGLFSGTFTTEFSLNNEGVLSPWYFSTQAPTKGAGYIFDGQWASYRNASNTKPVLFAGDLFIIANNILTEFSYGEREVEINPKYRHLGWENFWDGEEWWVEAPAKVN